MAASLFLLYIQYPIHLMFYEWAFFAFKDDAIRLQRLNRMPYTFRNVHAISSIIEPSSLCVVTLTFPRRITNVSSFVGCLCIGTSVPGSTAFRNRWHFSSRLRWPRALLAHSEGLEKLKFFASKAVNRAHPQSRRVLRLFRYFIQ